MVAAPENPRAARHVNAVLHEYADRRTLKLIDDGGTPQGRRDMSPPHEIVRLGMVYL